ncbi:MAG: aspartate aminotransferase family protein [Deltaproteobacteria bacterium]|nr:aspartate aminotransferase family protein [Deltaproteobacteria bacterium]MBW2306687.1 aspartate aminotransferase family protein [Deltaproteobacteria bacterium]
MHTSVETKEEFEKVRSLEQKAQKYLAGGCLGTFRAPLDPIPVISHGEGSRIIDAQGRSYIDFIMGSGPLILGHSHPALVSAVERQLRHGTTYYWIGEHIVQLAEKIVQAAPCGETVKFANSGTEATYHALRMARVYTGREKILKFEGGYHGVHDYSLMSAHPKNVGSYPEAKPDSGGIPRGIAESVLVAPFNDTETTAQIIQTHGHAIAAAIVEPLQRVIKPRGTFLNDVRKLTREHNIVLIFDEIVTGFRLDYGGAQEHYGVIPDVAVYGKALTGGFSLAAICGNREILDTTNPDRIGTQDHSYFSGTLNGNPLAAAAGLACLVELEKEGVLKGLHDRGERFMEEIRNLGRSCHVPLQVAGDGPVLQLFFTEKPIINYQDTLSQDKTLGQKVAKKMWEKGVSVVPNGKIYLSIAHSEEDFQRFLETLEDVLRSLS